MRPKKPETTRSGDLFRARLDQTINLKHELAQLAGQIDWDFIDGEIAPLYSDKGWPGIPAMKCNISRAVSRLVSPVRRVSLGGRENFLGGIARRLLLGFRSLGRLMGWPRPQRG
jgi:hypothetical protein